jgi:hypothetical protein
MKTKLKQLATSLLVLATIGFSGLARTQETINTQPLEGFAEVPAIFSAGVGDFTAKLSRDATSLTYTIDYAQLSGTVTQAHLHFGREGVAGGVVAFLCSNVGAPAGTPACPGVASGTVTDSLSSADVVAPIQAGVGQGINAGDFSALVSAIRAGAVYVCVHSTAFPGGEIRAQIQ